MAAEAKRNQMLKEKAIALEYKISRLGVAGRAYYEASQISLRRNRMLIRSARTTNMLLHSALQLLAQKEQLARKEAGNLGGLRKQTKILRKEFDGQRSKTVALQLQLQKQITDTRSTEIECADMLDPNTPPLEKIRILDARLGAIVAKTRDTQVVEHHFENLLKPMREEKIIYASQLDSLTNIIDMKNGQMMQLRMLAFDAFKSRAQAKKELDELMVLFLSKMKLSPEMQAKILKAIKNIKIMTEVDSMRSMYTQYLFQEKQTSYLAQVHGDLLITLSQLRNEAPIPERKKSLPLDQVHVIATETKEMIRRVSTQPGRKNSFPLILIIDGTKKLVDKIHENNVVFETRESSPQKDVLLDTEMRLVKLLTGLQKKVTYLEELDKAKHISNKKTLTIVEEEELSTSTCVPQSPP